MTDPNATDHTQSNDGPDDERDAQGIAPHRDVENADVQRNDDPSSPANVRPATTDGVAQSGQGGAE